MPRAAPANTRAQHRAAASLCRAASTASPRKNARLTPRGSSHLQGNCAKRSFGAYRHTALLTGNIRKADVAAKANITVQINLELLARRCEIAAPTPVRAMIRTATEEI